MSILSSIGSGKTYIIDAIEGRNELSKNSIDFLEKQIAFWKPTNALMLGNVVNIYIAAAGPNCSLNMKHQNIDISKWDLYEMPKWREMLSGKTAKTNALLDSLMK